MNIEKTQILESKYITSIPVTKWLTISQKSL